MGFRSRRKREKITHNYTCSLTNEEFVTTENAPNPKELLSVKAFYDMNPEMDDRPAIVKKKMGLPASNEEKH